MLILEENYPKNKMLWMANRINFPKRKKREKNISKGKTVNAKYKIILE